MTLAKNPDEPVKMVLRLGSKLTNAEFLEKLQNAALTIKALPPEEHIPKLQAFLDAELPDRRIALIDTGADMHRQLDALRRLEFTSVAHDLKATDTLIASIPRRADMPAVDFRNLEPVTIPLKQMLWNFPDAADKVAGEVGRPAGNRAQRRAAKRGRSR